jgi:molybdenum cofactor cytidylyltransferase
VIAALLLAAGAGRRFGDSPKLLEELDGSALVRRAANALADPRIGELIVVVAPEHRDGIERALSGVEARVVVNPRAASGVGSSISCGITALSPGATAVLIALADEPAPSARARDAVLGEFARNDPDVRIVAPSFRGTPGHPVLFTRAVFGELEALAGAGDRGARRIVDSDRTRVAIVDIDEDPPADVDTPADLARLRTVAQNTTPSTRSGTPDP